jgi:predicted O-methyltransferase YrrM
MLTQEQFKMEHTKKSLEITERISNEMEGKTFHHHYHILYDIIKSYPDNYYLNYVEIGCYAGGSASLVSQRKNTNIFSIDLGNPIPPEIPIRNVNNFNIYNNQYEYIMGNSQEISTLEKLKTFINEIDVLFIDGDHTSIGVKNDFELYSPMVKNGGYIIFDDYNDHQFSPEVKPTVDNIISTLDGYEIIGTIPNTFKARPESMEEGNCFIIKKI